MENRRLGRSGPGDNVFDNHVLISTSPFNSFRVVHCPTDGQVILKVMVFYALLPEPSYQLFSKWIRVIMYLHLPTYALSQVSCANCVTYD